MTLVFALIGFGLIFQPSRFTQTPSYANLIDALPAWIWGVLYLIAAVGLAIYAFVPSRYVAIASHTFGVMIVSIWLAAFVIRAITDHATTVVNPVSWTVFLALLVRSGFSIFLGDPPVVEVVFGPFQYDRTDDAIKRLRLDENP